jgi:hypothetical protein
MPPSRIFNTHLSDVENAKIASLTKYEPQQDHVESIRTRKSKLDPHLPEILKRKSEGWSHQRIAAFLKTKYKIENVSASTVFRRINEFYKKG